MGTDQMRRGHDREQFFRRDGSVLHRLDFRQQHDEFVAPLAADGIGAAREARLQARGGRLQQLVADSMAERIVDVFEVVEVEIHQRDSLAMPLPERDRLCQALPQQCSIRQTGEEIVLGHIRHLGAGVFRSLGHRMGADRRHDQALVRFPQVRLGDRARLDFGLRRVFALVGGFLAPICGLLPQVSGRLAEVGGHLPQLGGRLAQVRIFFALISGLFAGQEGRRVRCGAIQGGGVRL